MTSFDPTHFNFVLLRDFQIAGTVPVYEYKNHPVVDGKRSFLRLNLYLTMDRTYVTIWHGLLEQIFTEAELTEGSLATVERPSDLDFLRSYDESLFRGYIDSVDNAEQIFESLRIGMSGHYSLPQVLSKGSDNKLKCDLVQDVD